MSVFPPSNLVVRNGRFQSPWVYVSPGPAALGVVSEFSDLLSASWLLLVSDRERELQLWQLVGDVWERVLVEGHPLIDSVMPAGSERFSLSFDNDGRVVVAYELNDGVHVWLWDDGWVETIFSGVDPIVVNSAFWTEDLSGDAVLVFFLPVSRDGRVLARWSGDGFVGVEGLVGIDFLVGVGGDVRGIDRVQVIGYKRYQVWARGVDGEKIMLVGESYPDPTDNIEMPSDAVTVGVTLIGGGSYVRT